jgi:hypothetical protein
LIGAGEVGTLGPAKRCAVPANLFSFAAGVGAKADAAEGKYNELLPPSFISL